MKIIKADVLGYCMGVRRAVESAEVALKEYKEKKVYSLGPLIHNETALEELSRKGLNIIQENELENLDSTCVVIIRAHGISPSVREKLVKNDVVIIDATCPRVTVSQNRVKEFSKKGYTIFLCGDKGHAEVEGIRGFSETDFYCIENLSEAEKIFKTHIQQKSLLLSQTTFSPVEFNKIAECARERIPDLEIINTICPATKQRQDALEKLCTKVDGVIVVGGKKSANTIRLFQKAASLVKNAIHIESEKEIPPLFYSLDSIGITAGASTPDSVIQKVVEKLQ